jgi:hypothetical protein
LISWRKADGGTGWGINTGRCALGIAARRSGRFGVSLAGHLSQLSAMARGVAGRSFGGGSVQNEFHSQRSGDRYHFGLGTRSVLSPPAPSTEAIMIYQLGWSTLPGLRGLSCSEFRAVPTTAPDNQGGVAVEFAGETERDKFLQQLEAYFAQRRFTNAADAFDTVKAYVLAEAAKQQVQRGDNEENGRRDK